MSAQGTAIYCYIKPISELCNQWEEGVQYNPRSERKWVKGWFGQNFAEICDAVLKSRHNQFYFNTLKSLFFLINILTVRVNLWLILLAETFLRLAIRFSKPKEKPFPPVIDLFKISTMWVLQNHWRTGRCENIVVFCITATLLKITIPLPDHSHMA